MGDVDGKGVLDLACGTGHYARLLKARGAENVHGVDNSEELLKEARRHESADGVTYYRHDLIEGPPPKPLFQPDIAIASWLLPYASNFNQAVGRARARGLGLREDQLGTARGGRRARHRGELRGGRGRVHCAARVSPAAW